MKGIALVAFQAGPSLCSQNLPAFGCALLPLLSFGCLGVVLGLPVGCCLYAFGMLFVCFWLQFAALGCFGLLGALWAAWGRFGLLWATLDCFLLLWLAWVCFLGCFLLLRVALGCFLLFWNVLKCLFYYVW